MPTAIALQDRGVVGDVCMAAANAEAGKWDVEMVTSYEEAVATAGIDFMHPFMLGKDVSGGGVVVEGNIGSGKTSMLNLINALCGAQVVAERFNGTLFRAMCNTHAHHDAVSPREMRLARRVDNWVRFAFQMSMLNSRAYNARELLRTSDSARRPAQLVHCFLVTPPDECAANIVTRGRPEERELGLDYLRAIDGVHLRMAAVLALHGHDVVTFAPIGAWDGADTPSAKFVAGMTAYATSTDRSCLPRSARVARVRTQLTRAELECALAKPGSRAAFNAKHGISPNDVLVTWETAECDDFCLSTLGAPLSDAERAAMRHAFATHLRLVLVSVVRKTRGSV